MSRPSTRNLADLRRELTEAHQRLGSWRAVADAFSTPEVALSKAMVYLIAERGHEPKRAEIRQALGLPLYVATEVIPVVGEVRHGAQVFVARTCPVCGQEFYTNHPRRRRCYTCSQAQWEEGDVDGKG